MTRPMSAQHVERIDLAPGLSISRVVTGLWQIADMERDGRTLDLDRAARGDAALRRRRADDVRHGRSLRVGRGRRRASSARERRRPAACSCFTKWVPKPGPVTTAERARRRRPRRSRASRAERDRPAAVPRLELRRSELARRAVPPAGAEARGPHPPPRPHQRRHRAPATWSLASGIEVVSNQVCVLAARSARRGRGWRPFCAEHGVQLLAYGTRRRRLAHRALARRSPSRTGSARGTWSQMKYGRFIRAAGGWDALQRVLRAAAARGRAARRVDRQRGQPLRARAAGVAGVIVGARLGRARAHRRHAAAVRVRARPTTTARELEAALATLHADSRRLRRRVPQAAVPHRVRRPQPSPRRASRRRTQVRPRPTARDAVPQRHAVGAAGRLRARGARGQPHRRLGHDRHARPTASSAAAIRRRRRTSPSTRSRARCSRSAAALDDVVRTRVYVRHVGDWEAVARAHGERFGHIQPANTLVAAELIGDEYLVEIEAEAEIVG